MTDPPTDRHIRDKRGAWVRIAPYLPQHFDSLARMYREYPSEYRSHALPPVLDEEIEGWLHSVVERGRNFVAILDDEVVGHATYTPSSGEGPPDFVAFVDPDYHGRGIGTALVRHAIDHAAVDGLDRIVSYVERDNEAAASVYRTVGFEDVERDTLTVKQCIDLTDRSPSDADERLEDL